MHARPRSLSYSQKLKDPRWQKKRLHILQRDQWTCTICKSTTKTLQVHHVVYRRREPWDYPDYCYQTLCADCHLLRQELTDKAVDILRLNFKAMSNELMALTVQHMAGECTEHLHVNGGGQ
jgi:5-methylcytosine-specific restriction endonuclease McrA